MRLQILPGCTSDMWYSEMAGMEVDYICQQEDVYWAREPGFPFARNIVLKGDAVLVDEVSELEAFERVEERYSEAFRALADA